MGITVQSVFSKLPTRKAFLAKPGAARCVIFLDHDIVDRSIHLSPAPTPFPSLHAMREEGMRATEVRFRPGTHPRGEDTRRRMVETAIDVFASRGYEGSSTRLLAERAGVNLPAIQYYFGSKEGLYRAAIDYIRQRIHDGMEPVSERVTATLADGDPPRRTLLALLYDMLDAFLALIADNQHAEAQKLFIVRTEVERTVALAPLQDTMRRCVVGPCRALVARLIDREPEDEQTVARTLLIVGQVTIFGHKGLHRDLGWSALTQDHVRTVQALLREHTAAILHAAKGAAR